MKELKLYQCEVCGTEYSDESKAKECEKYHATGLRISGHKYDRIGRFPVKIWVKSKDGEERMYRL